MNCPKCGNPIQAGDTVCPACGSNLNQTVNQNGVNSQPMPNQTNSNPTPNYNPNISTSNTTTVNFGIFERSILSCILLSIVTCGIYGIYWFVKMTNESNALSKEKTASGGMAILLSLVTCGIYMIYWNYKMGKKMYEAGTTYGKDIKDNSVLYLVLSIFGLSIVNYVLIQQDINKFANR